MTRNILIVLSEYGYWGEELIGPLDAIDANGYKATFVTPTGKRPYALPPSKEAGFFDPPLDKVVVNEYYAQKTTEVDASGRLAEPLSLETWFPERPYFNSANFGHALEAYNDKRAASWKDLEQYDALVIVGGSGPLIDMCNNIRVHDLILGFLAQDKLIAAECYGVTCLAFARDFTDRKSIIWGKHVTGHAIEYDWHDGTGVLGIDHNFKWAFYPLEYILRDATGPEGKFHGGVGHGISTVLDYPFLTGRSTQDSGLVGELLVKVLEQGLRRYGW